jgi:hypothetical protein
MLKRVTVLAVLALFAVVASAQAQGTKGSVELGVDNAIGYDITGKLNDVEVSDRIFALIPFGNWRAGFYVNDKISIEPGLGFQFLNFSDDGGTNWLLNGTVDVVYNMPSGLLFHVGGLINVDSDKPAGAAAETTTVSQLGFGGGLGYRVEMATQLYLRLGLRGWYLLEKTDDGRPSTIRIAGVFGLSYFTK